MTRSPIYARGAVYLAADIQPTKIIRSDYYKMLELELETPTFHDCHCCGGVTTNLTRFVLNNGAAYGVYFARFTADHPQKEVVLVVSMGAWGEDASPDQRKAFALKMRATDDQYQVMVCDAADSPWQDAELLGELLDRSQALEHPWIDEVFQITDFIAEKDPEVKDYLDS